MLFERAEADERSKFLDSIGLPYIHAQNSDKGAGFYAIQEAHIDIEELVGDVCSYFMYQSCHIENVGE